MPTGNFFMYNKQVLLYAAVMLAGCVLAKILHWRYYKSAFRKKEAEPRLSQFDIYNHEDTPLLIQAEPDGETFVLPPRELVQVQYWPLGKGVALTYSMTDAGMRQVTLLDDGAGYEVYHNGKSILCEE